MTKKSIPPLAERISFLIHRVEAKTEIVCNPLFRDLGVALQDTRVLVNLLEAGQLKVGDLVNLMVVPQSTISHQLRSLEKRNLVRRSQAVADSRSVLVELTSHGREVAKRCNAQSEEVYRNMVAGLSQAELRRLRTQLRGIYQRLEEFGDRKATERLATRDMPSNERRRLRGNDPGTTKRNGKSNI